MDATPIHQPPKIVGTISLTVDLHTTAVQRAILLPQFSKILRVMAPPSPVIPSPYQVVVVYEYPKNVFQSGPPMRPRNIGVYSDSSEIPDDAEYVGTVFRNPWAGVLHFYDEGKP